MPLILMLSFVNNLVKKVIFFLFPRYCLACEVILNNHALLCPNCQSELDQLKAKPITCDLPTIYFDSAIALFAYSQLAKTMVLDFKFRHKYQLIPYYASLLRPYLTLYASKGYVAIFAPSSRKNYMPKYLARYISKDIKVISGLKKQGRAKQQKILNREARIKNLEGKISFKGSLLADKIILLDDIFTTGSTANQASKVLKENGAGRVEVICLTYANLDNINN